MFNAIKITYFLYKYIQFCLFFTQKHTKTRKNRRKPRKNRKKPPKNRKEQGACQQKRTNNQSNNIFITIQNKSTIMQHNTTNKKTYQKKSNFLCKAKQNQKHKTRLQINSIILIKYFSKQSTKQYLQS